uniref:Uncharacterized protein n=1 Tax=Arundo donax TaxID=35708 RepID=A0A0A9FX83_ARUDO
MMKPLLYSQINVTYFYNITHARFPLSQGPTKITNTKLYISTKYQVNGNQKISVVHGTISSHNHRCRSPIVSWSLIFKSQAARE